jgi:hypothetical protein
VAWLSKLAGAGAAFLPCALAYYVLIAGCCTFLAAT